jgi:predicted Rossmann-fold nucleotide-binding protein
LVGIEFWAGLKSWIQDTMLERHHTVNAEDLKLFHITDDPEEAVRVINEFYAGERQEKLSPNFEL